MTKRRSTVGTSKISPEQEREVAILGAVSYLRHHHRMLTNLEKGGYRFNGSNLDTVLPGATRFANTVERLQEECSRIATRIMEDASTVSKRIPNGTLIAAVQGEQKFKALRPNLTAEMSVTDAVGQIKALLQPFLDLGKQKPEASAPRGGIVVSIESRPNVVTRPGMPVPRIDRVVGK